MLRTMAAKHTGGRAAKKGATTGTTTATPRAPTPPARRKSKLTLASEDAARKLLLRTVRAEGWNLSASAVALDMTGAADVLRALKLLAPDELAAARAEQLIRAGRPKN